MRYCATSFVYGTCLMTMLAIGLLVFLGAHSVRVVAEDWRRARIASMGEGAWKGLYSIVSIVGFALIVLGYAQSRTVPIDLWHPPPWTKHVAALLTIPAFVLLAAAYVPRTRIKTALKHPMLLGVKLWAFAHLLANGRLADVVLFGAFLAWAILDFRAGRRRDRAAKSIPHSGALGRDGIALVIGLGAWAAFAFYLHAAWIGVRPFG